MHIVTITTDNNSAQEIGTMMPGTATVLVITEVAGGFILACMQTSMVSTILVGHTLQYAISFLMAWCGQHGGDCTTLSSLLR